MQKYDKANFANNRLKLSLRSIYVNLIKVRKIGKQMNKDICANLDTNNKKFRKYWWLKSVVRKHWLLELSILFLLIAEGGMAIVTPYSLKKIFDLVVVQGDMNALKFWGFILLGIPLLSFLVKIILGFLYAVLTNRFTIKCRDILYEVWLNISDKQTSRIHGGEILARMGQDMNTVSSFVGAQILAAISAVVTFIAISIYLIRLEPLLLLATYLIIPIFCLLSMKFGRQVVLTSTWMRATAEQLLESIHQSLRAFRYIKARNTCPAEKLQFSNYSKHASRANIVSSVTTARFSAYSTLLLTLGSVLVVVIGVVFIRLNRLTIGGLIAYMTSFHLLVTPMGSIVMCFLQAKRFQVSLGRLDDFIGPYQQAPINELPIPKSSTGKSLIIHDVSYSYNEKRPIFEDVNIEIQPGKTIAIIGESGIGKSTLCRILAGLSRPTPGNLKIDGIDIWKGITHYRNIVSFLPQELSLFSDTLLYNLTYGCNLPSGDNDNFLSSQLKELVELFNLKPFVDSLPNAYETVLDNAEMRVSAGQKQRICLISAMLKKAELYFFDEPSNALDTANVDHLIQAIELLKSKSKAIVIFTHDKRLFDFCDTVYSLTNGKLILGNYLKNTKQIMIEER
jgi:ABC-type bacteriocin/lantibiotic exporter with double-glycine peptidase domain